MQLRGGALVQGQRPSDIGLFVIWHVSPRFLSSCSFAIIYPEVAGDGYLSTETLPPAVG